MRRNKTEEVVWARSLANNHLGLQSLMDWSMLEKVVVQENAAQSLIRAKEMELMWRLGDCKGEKRWERPQELCSFNMCSNDSWGQVSRQFRFRITCWGKKPFWLACRGRFEGLKSDWGFGRTTESSEGKQSLSSESHFLCHTEKESHSGRKLASRTIWTSSWHCSVCVLEV